MTNAAYRQLVLEQLPELRPEQVLCEPVGRNTAPCIAYAAFRLKALQPSSTMVVAPSDHFIFDEEEFLRDITSCMEFADRHPSLAPRHGLRLYPDRIRRGDLAGRFVPRETRSADRHELPGGGQLPLECRDLRLVDAEHPRGARTPPPGGLRPLC